MLSKAFGVVVLAASISGLRVPASTTTVSIARPLAADSDTAEVGPLWSDPMLRAPNLTIIPSGGGEFPLLDEQGCAAAEVRVNGRGPYRFLIETGAAESNLRSHLAHELGVEGEEGRLDSISIGSVQLRGLTVQTSYPVESLLGTADGVLGLNTYHDAVLTLDYPHHRARLEAGELPPVNGRDILPLQHIAGHHLFRFPITVAGQPTMAVLDTQNHGTFWVAPGTIGSLPLGPLLPAGTFETPNVGAAAAEQTTLHGDVVIAGVTFSRPALEIAPMKRGYEGMWNVGCGVLQNFVVSIDERHQRVRFSRPEKTPPTLPGALSGSN
jgi:hypothetical protein